MTQQEKVALASTNPVKYQATEDILKLYPSFKDLIVVPLETESGVSDQPKSLDETVRGAITRRVKSTKL